MQMWQDLLSAVALLMVMEGILPFLNPAILRRTLLQMAQLEDRALRIAGLLSMLGGLFLLYWVRQ